MTKIERTRLAESQLDLAEARAFLSYNPSTGDIIWKEARGKAAKGSVGGFLMPDGYLAIRIFGRNYPAHRMAWFLHFGRWPHELLDHANGKRDDNRLENLREASVGQNNCNVKPQTRSVSKLKGVAWHSRDRRWQAKICCGGQAYYLGQFDTEEEAHAAYCAAAHEKHGAFARTA